MIRYAILAIMLVLTPKQSEAAKIITSSKTTRHLLYGGSRSGKSALLGAYLTTRAKQYGGSSHIVFRRTYADAVVSIWNRTILPFLKIDENAGLCTILKKPHHAIYTNGSVIEIGGLHPSEIDKHLGKEYGTIWVNEASEVGYENIPILMTRLNAVETDSTGKMIVPKFICDENPPNKNHWSFKLFVLKNDPEEDCVLPDADNYDSFKMNPIDNIQNLSPQYMNTLNALSSRQKKRFRDGEFGTTTGLVYPNFDEGKHLFDDIPPADWPQYSVFDFGFTHPFVHLRAAYDDSNERLHFYTERYQPGVTVRAHAEEINAEDKEAGRTYAQRVADHDAEDRATLAEHGIKTIPANKDVQAGTDLVFDLLDRDKIRFHRSMLNTINEFYGYKWKDGTQKDREPLKKDDHSMDAIRYLCMHVYKSQQAPMTVGKIGWL